MPPQENKPERKYFKREYIDLLAYSAVGIEMGAAVAIGAAIGYYLDKWIVTTKPYLTLVFMLFGVAAAGRAFWRTANQMKKKIEELDRERDQGRPE